MNNAPTVEDEDGTSVQHSTVTSICSIANEKSITLLTIAKDFMIWQVSKERHYFSDLCGKGIESYYATDLTIKKFSKLMEDGYANPRGYSNHYITDMAPSYYAIGLELDIRTESD